MKISEEGGGVALSLAFPMFGSLELRGGGGVSLLFLFFGTCCLYFEGGVVGGWLVVRVQLLG